MASNIILAIWTALFTLYVLFYVYKSAKVYVLYSSKKWLRIFRLRTWNNVVSKYRNGGYIFDSTDHKAHIFFIRWLAKSQAAKQFYINHGYDELRVNLVEKFEEFQRFADTYKYNTFDNLSRFEEDFIDNFQKKKKNP